MLTLHPFQNKKTLLIGIGIFSLMFVKPAQAENWQLKLSLGYQTQDYQENDSSQLTPDGVLNTESGSMPTVELSIINAFDPILVANNAGIPYGKLNIRYTNGKTNYDGYLQSGNQLTPFQSDTDNQMWRIHYDLGLTQSINANLSITPLASVIHQRWKRELTQYTEDFHHTAVSVGANIDWQPSGTHPLALQMTGKIGKIVDSNISVPKLGLEEDIGREMIYDLGVSGQYRITENLSLHAGVSEQKWDYEQSNIDNGYQYPDSKIEQTLWQLGLGYEF